MKKRTLLVVGVVLTLVLSMGLLTGCGSSAKVDSKGDGSSNSSEPAEQDLTNLAVGTVIDLDGVKVSVDAVTDGPADLMGSPTKQVTVTYKNDSDKSVSFNPYDWKIENANGVRSDADAFTDADSLKSGDLAPGGTITGNLFFEETAPTKVVYVPNFWADDDQLIFWTVQ